MIQLAESDQQADVNFLAKNYYRAIGQSCMRFYPITCFLFLSFFNYLTQEGLELMLRFIKDEALDDHLFMWNEIMEDPFMLFSRARRVSS